MVRTGFVKEKRNGQLRVCFQRPEACEGCKGCAKGLLPRQELLTVFGQAEVGDVVDRLVPVQGRVADGILHEETLVEKAVEFADERGLSAHERYHVRHFTRRQMQAFVSLT